jgi:D-3-phosphoglycerate dehydrogenase / 2-oxoglutarate reductase
MILRFPDATEAMAGLLAGPLAKILPGLQVGVAAPDPAALIAGAHDADGLVLMRTRVDAATLAALPRLKALAFLSTGVASWVDLEAAAASGIGVRGVRGYGDQSVAEHALALMLSALRGVAATDRALREGRWIEQGGRELAGSRLAVIGLGGVGRAIAALGRALGCEVVGWSRTPSCAATMLPLDACLATADIVSLHLALTAETCGLIDRRRISLLRPGAVLVNTARGGLLDEAALVERLQHGDIAAGLDVYGQEPLPAGHPLLGLSNVTLTPHIAWNTGAARHRLLEGGLLALREAMASTR